MKDLSAGIRRGGFISSWGDRQVFVSVGLCIKDGQIM